MEFAFLHNQTYDLSETRVTIKDVNNASSGVARDLRSLDDEFSAYLEASNDMDLSVGPNFTRQTGIGGSSDLMEVGGNDEAQPVETPVMGSRHEEHTVSLEPTSDVAEAKSSQEFLGEITEMDIDGKSISDVDAVNRDAAVDAVNMSDMTAGIVQLGSSDKTSVPDASLQIDAPGVTADQQLSVEIDANADTEKKDDNIDAVEHEFRMTEEVLLREMEGGASVEVGTDIQTEVVAHSQSVYPSTTFSPETGGCSTQILTVDHVMEDVGQAVVQEDSFLDAEVDYNAKNLVTDGVCGEELIIDSSNPAELNADLGNVFIDNGQTSFLNEASQLNTMDVGVFPTDQVDRDVSCLIHLLTGSILAGLEYVRFSWDFRPLLSLFY